MGFREVAETVCAWAAIGAGVIAVAKLTYDSFFTRRTPTTFDDPEIQASRARSADIRRRLDGDAPKVS